MHDVLAHRLSRLATYAGAIEYRPDAPPEQVARAAGVVRAGAHQALDELREVITMLREDDGSGDGSAGDGGAGQRPQPGLADLPRLVEESRDAGARVQLDDRVADPGAVPEAAGRTAYRVVQEGLTNARKHAPDPDRPARPRRQPRLNSLAAVRPTGLCRPSIPASARPACRRTHHSSRMAISQ
jgi:signal transduction histidine kinase